MNKQRVEQVIKAVCDEFEVELEELGEMRGQETRQVVKQARMACALLARQAAGVPLTRMAEAMGYQSIRYLRQLRRKGLMWLCWASREEPPYKEVARFRAVLERLCLRLEVDIEELAEKS